MSQQAKAENNILTLQALNAKANIAKEAREYNNKGFQWTRRFIAIAAISAIIVWPKFAPLMDIPVVVGWTEWNPGFLFIPGKESTMWHVMEGLVITPLDTHLVSSIAGLYFGASIVGNRT